MCHRQHRRRLGKRSFIRKAASTIRCQEYWESSGAWLRMFLDKKCNSVDKHPYETPIHTGSYSKSMFVCNFVDSLFTQISPSTAVMGWHLATIHATDMCTQMGARSSKWQRWTMESITLLNVSIYFWITQYEITLYRDTLLEIIARSIISNCNFASNDNVSTSCSYAPRCLVQGDWISHIEAETRWPPLSRRQFEMNFLERK